MRLPCRVFCYGQHCTNGPYNLPMAGFSVAILAGGQSSRFGSNKALTAIGGLTIIERVLRAAHGLASDVFIVTNTPETYGHLGRRMVPDILPEGGALRGLHTALSAARQPWVLCLACDMPFVQVSLLKHLIGRAQEPESADLGAVVPRHAEGTEPFCAAYQPRVCLPELLPLLAARRYRMVGLLERVPVRYIEPPELTDVDPGLTSFINVNTPDELKEALELARRLDADS